MCTPGAQPEHAGALCALGLTCTSCMCSGVPRHALYLKRGCMLHNLT